VKTIGEALEIDFASKRLRLGDIKIFGRDKKMRVPHAYDKMKKPLTLL